MGQWDRLIKKAQKYSEDILDVSVYDYPDVTKEFFDFCTKQTHPDASFSVLIIAQKRWGKSETAAAMIERLMENPDRKLYLLECPQLEKLIGAVYPGRVFSVTKLGDIPNNAIIYFDETLVSLNGKRALTKFSRKVGEALSYTSHKKIIVIGNAQTDGMIADLRNKAEIVILGRLPIFFLSSCKEEFIKQLKDKLLWLPKEEAYIYSNSFAGFEAKGRLIGDKRKWCSWFTEEMSRNMSEVSLDSDRERKQNDLQIVNEIVAIMLQEFPIEVVKKTTFTGIMKGYIMKKDVDLYCLLDERSLWSSIQNALSYEGYAATPDPTPQVSANIGQLTLQYTGVDFPEFCRTNLKPVDSIMAELAYYWAMGLSYREIYPIVEKMGVGPYQVNTLLKQFCEDGSEKDATIRSGYLFERWFAHVLGPGAIVADPDSHDPDVLCNEKAYSCKCYSDTNACKSLKQSKFNPERIYAKKRSDHYYAVGYFPKWGVKSGNFVYIAEVDPEGNEYVTFDRDDATQFFTVSPLGQLTQIHAEGGEKEA